MQADESAKRKLSRKRVAKPDTWQSNIRKMKRDHGEDYTTRKGKTVPAKRMKFTTKKDDTENNTCKRFKCQEKFGEVELGVVFADYYSLSKIRKQDYLSSLIEDEEPSTVTREHANDPV